MTSPVSSPATDVQDLWCRLERDGERVVGVGLMHPDGRILFSYAADHFDAGLLRRMESGQVRAYLSSGGGGRGPPPPVPGEERPDRPSGERRGRTLPPPGQGRPTAAAGP